MNLSEKSLIVLVGAPGAGKTTVGKIVADELGVQFHDTDHLIETQTNRSVQDIFIEDGEEVFRRIERDTVKLALENEAGVLALGGGSVLNPDTRDQLKEKTVFWLKVDAANASKRVGLDKPRPVLVGNVRASMVRLLNDRAPIYSEVADFSILTDEIPPSEVAAHIVSLHEGLTK